MRSLLRKELWTRELIAWYLYDFANSFVYINATLYFSQWVVVDRGFTDFWFSLPFILATVILILTSSYVGSFGDRTGKHFRVFFGASALAIASMFFMFLAGRFLPSGIQVAVALVFFGLYQLGYLLAFVPYNAFIKHIAVPEQYGTVSGIGLGWSQLGNICGLLVTLPIIQKTVVLFGTDRLAPLIPALVAFALFAAPSFFVFRNKVFPHNTAPQSAVPWWRSFWTHLMESRNREGVFPFLLAYYFFSDAILTLSLYSAIYLERVFHSPDETKVVMSLLTLGGFALGAFALGVVADARGHRRVLIASLAVNAVSILGIAFASDFRALYPLFVLFGLSIGGVYASSRGYLASLIGTEESGKYFGLYTFAERFASVIGPAVWGIVIILFGAIAPTNYRIAAAVMGVIALLGIIPLLKWRAKIV